MEPVMDTTSPDSPTSPEKSSEPSPSEETSSETTEPTHEHIQAELRELLEEVQTSFRPFEETIFTKIDAMQDKINQLGNSVADLSVTTKPVDTASGSNGSPVHTPQQGAGDNTPAPEP